MIDARERAQRRQEAGIWFRDQVFGAGRRRRPLLTKQHADEDRENDDNEAAKDWPTSLRRIVVTRGVGASVVGATGGEG